MEQANTATPVLPVQGSKKSNGALIGIILGVVGAILVGILIFFLVKGGSSNLSDPKADNRAYFIKINGKTFNIDSKISELESVGYKMNDSAKSTKVPANKYLLLIGGSRLTNQDDKSSFEFTSYNDSDSEVVITDAKLGRVLVSYGINEEDLASTYESFEFYGGIHLGSTEKELKEAFGEPTSTSDGTDYKGNAYTDYTYSDKVFRKFVFRVADGKVIQIEWVNYGDLA